MGFNMETLIKTFGKSDFEENLFLKNQVKCLKIELGKQESEIQYLRSEINNISEINNNLNEKIEYLSKIETLSKEILLKEISILKKNLIKLKEDLLNTDDAKILLTGYRQVKEESLEF